MGAFSFLGASEGARVGGSAGRFARLGRRGVVAAAFEASPGKRERQAQGLPRWCEERDLNPHG